MFKCKWLGGLVLLSILLLAGCDTGSPTIAELDAFWTDISKWDASSPWDFDNVWNRASSSTLPTLRGMPGEALNPQDPRIIP